MGCARFPLQKIVFRSNQGAMDMEKYVHWENVALFKKRLAEAHSDAEREVLLKLLADEEGERASAEKWYSQASLICITASLRSSV